VSQHRLGPAPGSSLPGHPSGVTLQPPECAVITLFWMIQGLRQTRGAKRSGSGREPIPSDPS